MTASDSLSPRISEEARTALMISTSFETAEKIMTERKLTPADVAFHYAHRLIYKIWQVQDTPDDRREAYRDAVLSFMSSIVDREIDGWGDGSPPRDSLSAEDAVSDGREAAQAASLAIRLNTPGPTGQVHAVVEITEDSKPLVRALAAAGLGSFDPIVCAFVVTAADLVGGLPQHLPSHMRVISAFVAPLRAKGFVVGVRTITNSDQRSHG